MMSKSKDVVNLGKPSLVFFDLEEETIVDQIFDAIILAKVINDT